MIVAGASSHPGKFGFVVLHNILAHGYAGRVFATNRDAAARGDTLLGLPALASVEDVPDGAADLVFVCTPVERNVERAARLRGPGRAGRVRDDRRATARPAPPGGRPRRELVDAAAALGLLLAGPERPGRRVDPVGAVRADGGALPARGAASRSRASRATSSRASRTSPRHLRRRRQPRGVGGQRGGGRGGRLPRATSPTTRRRAVSIAYLEGIDDGRALFERLRAAAATPARRAGEGGRDARGRSRRRVAHRRAGDRRPRVHRRVPAGGRHARRDRRRGVRRRRHARNPTAPGAAPTRSCSPPPADGACSRRTRSPGRSCASLELPTDLREAIDAKLPPRWSRANPVDLAAAETRDTIPEVLELARPSSGGAQRDLPRPRRAVEPGPHAPGRRVRRRRRASSASRRSTSARTSATPGWRPRSPPPPARRSCVPPSSRSATPTTPARVRCAPRVATACRPRLAPCAHSSTRGSAPATSPGGRRMTTARRWIAAGLVLAAVVALVLAFTGDPSPSGAAPAAPGATPHVVGAARAAADRRRGRRPAPADRARPRGGRRRRRASWWRTTARSWPAATSTRRWCRRRRRSSSSPLPRSTRSAPTSPSRPRLLAPQAPASRAWSTSLWFVGSGDPVIATDEFVAFVDRAGTAPDHRVHPPRAARRPDRDRGHPPDPGRDRG